MRRLFLLPLCTALLSLLTAGSAPTATVAGRVVDAESGLVVPATVVIRTSDGRIIADHPSYRGGFRCDGSFEKEVPPGDTVIAVTRGFDYLPVQFQRRMRQGERHFEQFVLRRRSPLRKDGWYASDHHAHMIHGERTTLVDFQYVALAGRAEGLDFLSVAQSWNLPLVSPEELDRATRDVSGFGFQLTWNLEAPKNYYRGDASKCLGHGWTVNLRGRTPGGRDVVAELLDISAHDYENEKPPYANFESHALIHSLGGIVSYSHPARFWHGKWGGRGIYPVEENKFVSNMAQELPFDTLVGPTYDCIDILMQPQEKEANAEALKLWFLLLDRGYHIAASASSDATFDNPGRGVPGKVRIYTRIEGKPDLPRIAAAIRSGRSFVTSGPLLVLDIAGRGSGEVITLPAKGRKGRIRAWGDRLTRIEILRNGEIVRSFNADGQSEFTAQFDVNETAGRAWYVARCYGAEDTQVAITNPIWFEPRGWQPPQPAPAHVTGSVLDASTGKALDGSVEVLRMVGKEPVVVSRSRTAGGRFELTTSGTARLRVEAPGYKPLARSVFLDSAPLLETATGLRPGQLTDWNTFEKVKTLLGHVALEFRLERSQ
jgi:hypothetical protein